MKFQNNQIKKLHLKTISLSLFFISGLVFCGTAGANQNTADKPANIAIHYNIPFFGLVGVNDNTDLSRAVRDNNPKKVIALLEAGADPNAVDLKSAPPIHRLIALLEARADTNTADRQDQTPLHYAAQLKIGKNIADAYGQTTPLYNAIWSNKNLKVVAALLEAKANPNATDRYDQTPLHYAAQSKKNLKIVATLLEAGADPNTADRYGHAPLHYAVRSPENLKIVAALLEAGADPNAANRYGHTLLHYAAQLPENLKIVAALLKAKANPNTADRYDQTPLHYAVRSKTDPSTVDKYGYYIFLYNAVQSKKILKVVTTLLKAGADPNATDERDQTALDYAELTKNRTVITALAKTRCSNSFK